MAKTILEKKSKEVQVLDETTQALLTSIENKDRKRRFWYTIAFFMLLTVGIVGVYYQNYLASQNKQHIDCIIKDLSTPLPQGSRSKYIQILSSECHIKFTP